MYKPSMRFAMHPTRAWAHGLGLLVLLIALWSLLRVSENIEWQVSSLWALLADLASILFAFSSAWMCRYYYRKSDSYPMLLLCVSFFTFCAIELAYFMTSYQWWFVSPLANESLAKWLGIITRGSLVFILFSSAMLLHRLRRLANGGKMTSSVLTIAGGAIVLLTFAALYVVSLPLMQSALRFLSAPLALLVSATFILLIISCAIRLRWLSESLEYGMFVFICIQFILYFYQASPQLKLTPIVILALSLSKLLSYLVVIVAIYLQAQSSESLPGMSKLLRRESRLIRLFERSRNRKYPWFMRAKNSLSSYVSLLSVCLVVAGTISTYLIFYFAFSLSLENERRHLLGLHNVVQTERLERVIKLSYDEIDDFSKQAVFTDFLNQQFIEGRFINIEAQFWQPLLSSHINKVLSRVTGLRSVHLVIVAQGQQFDYLSVGQGDLSRAPKSLLLLAGQEPNVVHAQAIRQDNDGLWSLAKAVKDQDGKVVAICLFQYQLNRVFSSVLKAPLGRFEGDLPSASLEDALLVFDVNGEHLWRSRRGGASSHEFQAAEYQRIKQLLASPITNATEQVVKYGSYLLSIQRIAYMPNQPQDFLDLVLVANYQETLAAAKLAAKQALLVAMLVVGFIVLLAWFFSHTITSPLRYITNAILLFGERNMRVALPAQSMDEVGVLARAISQMATRVDDRIEHLEHEVQLLQQSQQQLKDELHRAETMLEAKSEFLTMMSHEMRTPVNGILHMTQLLSASSLSPDQIDYLNTIRLSGKSLLMLANDFRDYAKVEMEVMPLRIDTFDLSLSLLEVIRIFTLQARAKHLLLDLDYSSQLPKFFIGDQGRIQQIFINLVSNALKYTEVGHVTIKVDCIDSSEMVRIRVIDTGIGFSEKAQENLFQEAGSVEERVGLKICQHLVALMQGEIKLVSRLGVGSEFSVYLPLPRVDAECSESASQIGREKAPLMRLSGQILLLEDSPLKQRMINYMLNGFGLKLMFANNAHEAIELFKGWGSQLSLILINCQLEEQSGYQVSSLIRKLESNAQRIPIIGVTTELSNQAKQASYDSGMDDLVQYPFERDILYRCLSQWLRIRSTAAQQLGGILQSESDNGQYLSLPDIKQLRLRLGEQFEAHMLEYQTASLVLIEELHQALAKRQFDVAMRLTHSLKSTSAYVGASIVARQSESLQTLLEQRKPSVELSSLVSNLSRSLNETLVRINQYLSC